jgi:hypothetical protein
MRRAMREWPAIERCLARDNASLCCAWRSRITSINAPATHHSMIVLA